MSRGPWKEHKYIRKVMGADGDYDYFYADDEMGEGVSLGTTFHATRLGPQEHLTLKEASPDKVVIERQSDGWTFEMTPGQFNQLMAGKRPEKKPAAQKEGKQPTWTNAPMAPLQAVRKPVKTQASESAGLDKTQGQLMQGQTGGSVVERQAKMMEHGKVPVAVPGSAGTALATDREGLPQQPSAPVAAPTRIETARKLASELHKAGWRKQASDLMAAADQEEKRLAAEKEGGAEEKKSRKSFKSGERNLGMLRKRMAARKQAMQMLSQPDVQADKKLFQEVHARAEKYTNQVNELAEQLGAKQVPAISHETLFKPVSEGGAGLQPRTEIEVGGRKVAQGSDFTADKYNKLMGTAKPKAAPKAKPELTTKEAPEAPKEPPAPKTTTTTPVSQTALDRIRGKHADAAVQNLAETLLNDQHKDRVLDALRDSEHPLDRTAKDFLHGAITESKAREQIKEHLGKTGDSEEQVAALGRRMDEAKASTGAVERNRKMVASLANHEHKYIHELKDSGNPRGMVVEAPEGQLYKVDRNKDLTHSIRPIQNNGQPALGRTATGIAAKDLAGTVQSMEEERKKAAKPETTEPPAAPAATEKTPPAGSILTGKGQPPAAPAETETPKEKPPMTEEEKVKAAQEFKDLHAKHEKLIAKLSAAPTKGENKGIPRESSDWTATQIKEAHRSAKELVEHLGFGEMEKTELGKTLRDQLQDYSGALSALKAPPADIRHHKQLTYSAASGIPEELHEAVAADLAGHENPALRATSQFLSRKMSPQKLQSALEEHLKPAAASEEEAQKLTDNFIEGLNSSKKKAEAQLKATGKDVSTDIDVEPVEEKPSSAPSLGEERTPVKPGELALKGADLERYLGAHAKDQKPLAAYRAPEPPGKKNPNRESDAEFAIRRAAAERDIAEWQRERDRKISDLLQNPNKADEFLAQEAAQREEEARKPKGMYSEVSYPEASAKHTDLVRSFAVPGKLTQAKDWSNEQLASGMQSIHGLVNHPDIPSDKRNTFSNILDKWSDIAKERGLTVPGVEIKKEEPAPEPTPAPAAPAPTPPPAPAAKAETPAPKQPQETSAPAPVQKPAEGATQADVRGYQEAMSSLQSRIKEFPRDPKNWNKEQHEELGDLVEQLENHPGANASPANAAQRNQLRELANLGNYKDSKWQDTGLGADRAKTLNAVQEYKTLIKKESGLEKASAYPDSVKQEYVLQHLLDPEKQGDVKTEKQAREWLDKLPYAREALKDGDRNPARAKEVERKLDVLEASLRDKLPNQPETPAASKDIVSQLREAAAASSVPDTRSLADVMEGKQRPAENAPSAAATTEKQTESSAPDEEEEGPSRAEQIREQYNTLKDKYGNIKASVRDENPEESTVTISGDDYQINYESEDGLGIWTVTDPDGKEIGNTMGLGDEIPGKDLAVLLAKEHSAESQDRFRRELRAKANREEAASSKLYDAVDHIRDLDRRMRGGSLQLMNKTTDKKLLQGIVDKAESALAAYGEMSPKLANLPQKLKEKEEVTRWMNDAQARLAELDKGEAPSATDKPAAPAVPKQKPAPAEKPAAPEAKKAPGATDVNSRRNDFANKLVAEPIGSWAVQHRDKTDMVGPLRLEHDANGTTIKIGDKVLSTHASMDGEQLHQLVLDTKQSLDNRAKTIIPQLQAAHDALSKGPGSAVPLQDMMRRAGINKESDRAAAIYAISNINRLSPDTSLSTSSPSLAQQSSSFSFPSQGMDSRVYAVSMQPKEKTAGKVVRQPAPSAPAAPAPKQQPAAPAAPSSPKAETKIAPQGGQLGEFSTAQQQFADRRNNTSFPSDMQNWNREQNLEMADLADELSKHPDNKNRDSYRWSAEAWRKRAGELKSRWQDTGLGAEHAKTMNDVFHYRNMQDKDPTRAEQMPQHIKDEYQLQRMLDPKKEAALTDAQAQEWKQAIPNIKTRLASETNRDPQKVAEVSRKLDEVAARLSNKTVGSDKPSVPAAEAHVKEFFPDFRHPQILHSVLSGEKMDPGSAAHEALEEHLSDADQTALTRTLMGEKVKGRDGVEYTSVKSPSVKERLYGALNWLKHAAGDVGKSAKETLQKNAAKLLIALSLGGAAAGMGAPSEAQAAERPAQVSIQEQAPSSPEKAPVSGEGAAGGILAAAGVAAAGRRKKLEDEAKGDSADLEKELIDKHPHLSGVHFMSRRQLTDIIKQERAGKKLDARDQRFKNDMLESADKAEEARVRRSLENLDTFTQKAAAAGAPGWGPTSTADSFKPEAPQPADLPVKQDKPKKEQGGVLDKAKQMFGEFKSKNALNSAITRAYKDHQEQGAEESGNKLSSLYEQRASTHDEPKKKAADLERAGAYTFDNKKSSDLYKQAAELHENPKDRSEALESAALSLRGEPDTREERKQLLNQAIPYLKGDRKKDAQQHLESIHAEEARDHRDNLYSELREGNLSPKEKAKRYKELADSYSLQSYASSDPEDAKYLQGVAAAHRSDAAIAEGIAEADERAWNNTSATAEDYGHAADIYNDLIQHPEITQDHRDTLIQNRDAALAQKKNREEWDQLVQEWDQLDKDQGQPQDFGGFRVSEPVPEPTSEPAQDFGGFRVSEPVPEPTSEPEPAPAPEPKQPVALTDKQIEGLKKDYAKLRSKAADDQSAVDTLVVKTNKEARKSGKPEISRDDVMPHLGMGKQPEPPKPEAPKPESPKPEAPKAEAPKAKKEKMPDTEVEALARLSTAERVVDEQDAESQAQEKEAQADLAAAQAAAANAKPVKETTRDRIAAQQAKLQAAKAEKEKVEEKKKPKAFSSPTFSPRLNITSSRPAARPMPRYVPEAEATELPEQEQAAPAQYLDSSNPELGAEARRKEADASLWKKELARLQSEVEKPAEMPEAEIPEQVAPEKRPAVRMPETSTPAQVSSTVRKAVAPEPEPKLSWVERLARIRQSL